MCQQAITPKEPDGKAKRNLEVGDVVRAVEDYHEYIVKGQRYVVTKAPLYPEKSKHPTVRVRPYAGVEEVANWWLQSRFEYLGYKEDSVVAENIKPYVAPLIDLREPEAKRYHVIGTGYDGQGFDSIDALIEFVDSKGDQIEEGTYTVAVEYGEIEVKRKASFNLKD